MSEVNQVIELRPRLPKRQRPRWRLGIGRWRGEAREVQVVDLQIYRQRRRPHLPVTAVAVTGGEPA